VILLYNAFGQTEFEVNGHPQAILGPALEPRRHWPPSLDERLEKLFCP
jgi:hypothetical protein